MPTTRPAAARKRLIGCGLLVLLVVAMALNTKFLTAQSLAAIGPSRFDPAKTAGDLFASAQGELPAKAKPLPDVLRAVQSDIGSAVATYGAATPSEGSFTFTITATGTVDSSRPGYLSLTVPDVPPGTSVLVPTTTAINGSVLRDAVGFKFADAPGQTDYQFVGDELKKLQQSEVVAPVGDPAALQGKTVTVVGVMSVVAGPGVNAVPVAKPANIQPVMIKVVE